MKGHGIDIVEIENIERFTHDEGFLRRVFADAELVEIPTDTRRLSHIAGRFAAKEAVLKAVGVGLGNGVSLQNVIVSREPNDAPRVELTGELGKLANEMEVGRIFLSISHSRNYAIASAIAVAVIPE